MLRVWYLEQFSNACVATLGNVVAVFQPMRSKGKTNPTFVTNHFRQLARDLKNLLLILIAQKPKLTVDCKKDGSCKKSFPVQLHRGQWWLANHIKVAESTVWLNHHILSVLYLRTATGVSKYLYLANI